MRNFAGVAFTAVMVLATALSIPACGSGGGGAPASGGAGGSGAGGSPAAGEIPVVMAAGAVPYGLGTNAYGISGAAFYAEAPQDVGLVVLDKTQSGKLCLKGTVPAVPVPADGSHPPYSDYWGVDLGFDLNDVAGDGGSVKSPWLVPGGVVGFWFTLDGATIPALRFKATPTGKDPALEEDSCALVDGNAGRHEILFTDMYKQCWDGPQGTAPNDITNGLVDMGFQIAAVTQGPIDVDFCITAVGALLQ
jgi:hypothetical protein